MSDQHELVSRLFLEAARLPPEERKEFLDRSCGGDETLRHEVARLLEEEKEVDSFEELIAPPLAEMLRDLRMDPTEQVVMEERPEPTSPAGKSTKSRKTLGDYRLLRELGRGGMGVVYEADQLSLNRRVALKVLSGPFAFSREGIEKFQREAEAAGRQRHPGIVAIYGCGEADEMHYISQELIPGGRTLHDFIAEARRQPQIQDLYYRQVASLIAETADALQAVHDSGVIHRDIKPGNILLTKEGRPKVSDFGLAKVEDALTLSRSGEFAGTPFYMSPEQAASKRMGIDHRTDVFSLGATLYELLTLRRPFDGDTSQQVIEKILLDDPIDPCKLRSRVPRDASSICLKAIEKRKEARYQSMKDFAADLRRWLTHQSIVARPPSALRRAHKWVRRHPTQATMYLALVLVTVLLLQTMEAKKIAGQQTVRAQDSLEDSRWSAYLANLNTAFLSIGQKRFAEAQVALDACPEKHRHWEWDYLYRLTDRSLSAMQLHAGGLSYVRWREDGRILTFGAPLRQEANYGRQTSVKVSSLVSGDTPFEFTGSYPQLARGGDHVVVRTTDGVRVWDLGRGEPGPMLQGFPPEWLYQISPQGDLVLSWSEVEPVGVWDSASGKRLQSLPSDGLMTCLAIRQDSRQVAMGLSNGEVKLWNLPEGHCELTFQEHSDRLLRLDFCLDGSLIVSETDQEILVWDAEIGISLAHFEGHRFRRSPEGDRIVFQNVDESAPKWSLGETESGDILASASGSPEDCYFSPNGELLVLLDRRVLQVWNAQDGSLLLLHEGQESNYRTVAFSPDQQLLATGMADGTWRLWCRHSWLGSTAVSGHEGAVLGLDFSPDMNEILTCSEDGTARLWSVDTSSITHAISAETPPLQCVAMETHSDLLALGDGSVNVQIVDTETGLRRPLGLPAVLVPTSLAFSADGQRVAASSGLGAPHLQIWDVASGRVIRRLEAPELVTAVALDQTGRKIAAATSRSVLLWDTDVPGEPIPMPRHEGPITGIALSRSGDRVFSVAADDTLRSCSAETGEVVFQTTLGMNGASCLALVPSGRLLVGSPNGVIEVWDVAEEKRNLVLKGHRGIVKALASSEDERRVFSVSIDSTLRIWDLKSGSLLLTLPAGEELKFVGFDADRKRVVTGGQEVLLWESRIDELRRSWQHQSMSWNLQRQVEAAYRQGQRPSTLDAASFGNDAGLLAEEAVGLAIEKGRQHAADVLRRSAWNVVVRSDGTPRQYEVAFEQATVAMDLVYSASTLQTLALAAYRVGRYKQALARLANVEDELNLANPHLGWIRTLQYAGVALSHAASGQQEQARQAIEDLDLALAQQPARNPLPAKVQQQLLGLRHEAVQLLGPPR